MKNKANLKRDRNILLSQQGYINMNTKSVQDKTKYNRKEKHKNKDRDDRKVFWG